MIEEIKQLFQDFIALQLEAIRGDIRALNSRIDALDMKFDARINALDMKIDALEMKFDAKFDGLDMKVESYHREVLSESRRIDSIFSSDFVRLEQKVDLKTALLETKIGALETTMNVQLGAMNEKLVFLRNELLAEIKVSRV